jgi:polyhydroxybutyrate depolymerase
MRRLLPLLLVPAVGLALMSGCHGGTRTSGSTTRQVTVDGQRRSYVTYRPANLPDSAPVPLVVMMHGGFGTAAQAEQDYGWDAEADRQHFVVVYPDGLHRAWASGGGCCGTPGSTGVDDVKFISTVVAAVTRDERIDPVRVYATGISNGGMMAYRLACDTNLFAAIGPDSATLLGACPAVPLGGCSPTPKTGSGCAPAPHPVSVIHIHGTADHSIPYDGGVGDRYAKIDGPPVPDLVAQWRHIDGCGAPAVTSAAPVTSSTAACPAGRSVELITVAGAGHQWPGGKGRPVAEKVLRLDTPSTALDATDIMWRFFAAHPGPA